MRVTETAALDVDRDNAITADHLVIMVNMKGYE
jgi:hypothetical protein